MAELTGVLRREPDNRFDPNAVAVDVEGRPVGYIPKALAAKLAARIDVGEEIKVTAVSITKSDKPGRTVFGVRIGVELQTENERMVV